MATAGSSKQQGGVDQAELDPRYEWQENATGFILRIHLPGFRKQDFRVQVDGAGRLTVRGQRSDSTAATAKHYRFSKVFQLPSTSNLDEIAGRFDAGVLTLTVPKRLPVPGKQQPPQQQVQADQAAAAAAAKQQEKAKEDEEAKKKPKDAAIAKPKAKDDECASATTKKPAAAEQQVADDAKTGKPEPEQQPKTAAPPPPPPAVRKEEGKPKAGAAADIDTKQQATPKPEPPPQAAADAERKAVDLESLAATVKRRAEEERTKAAAAAEEAETERQSKSACRGFRERVAEELQGLAGSEWAEGLVETVKKNKEVIAAAVAAFSLGVFVSSRLFSRSRN